MFSVSYILSLNYSYCPALHHSRALVTRRKTSVALGMPAKARPKPGHPKNQSHGKIRQQTNRPTTSCKPPAPPINRPLNSHPRKIIMIYIVLTKHYEICRKLKANVV